MFNRVLVPLDGSSFSEAALPTALVMAERFAADIRLLNIPRSNVGQDLHRTVANEQTAWGYLATVVERVRGVASVLVSGAVVHGKVAEAIASETAESHDLIVMASHRRMGRSNLWRRSVTDACIRSSTNPVLVVRPSDGDPACDRCVVDRVVIPLDGSHLAESALPIGVLMAEAFEAPLVLVRSVGASMPLVAPGGWVTLGNSLADARKYLAELAERATSPTIHPTVRLVVGESPARLIDEVAGEGGLIVMATHGHGGLRRAAVGSVTNEVLDMARAAVLVVHPRPGVMGAHTLDRSGSAVAASSGATDPMN
jgi:nucleotide-binding universal stress UspA family protein